VDAAARFAAEAALLDVLAEERAGLVFFAEGGVEVFEDFQADVEADEVDHLEGAHRVIEAELDGFVDVGSGGDACFEHGEASLPMSALMRVVMKPGASLTMTVSLPMRVATAMQAATVSSEVCGVRIISTSFILGTGLKKCMADAAFAMEDDIAEIADGERGRIAGEDGVGLGEFVENGEEFEFHFEFFGDGFYDEFGVADSFVDDLGGGDAGEGGVASGGFDFASADAFVE